MTWSLILLFFLPIYWPYQYYLFANADYLSTHGINRYHFVRAIHDETTTTHHRRKRSVIESNPDRILTLELDHKNITLILKNTNEFFATDADLHLDSSTYIPIDSSILYDGYVLDNPDQSYVSGGFYSTWFDGTIKTSNETWHIEPTRKYGEKLIHAGPSIIYNALDVDMTKYNSNNPFRSKRFVIDDDEEEKSSSFCGLDQDEKRKKMKEESQRLEKHNDEDEDFKSRYTRPKRQTTNKIERERTCCYIYIRVDPTLWDVVYKNEGLNEKEPTIHAIVTFLYRTVTAANAIYRSLKFESNGDILYRFTLRIKRIRILTPDDCGHKNLSLSETNICRSFLDSNVLLTWHSAENFADYCLAYIFAARDFGDGTLGLAWMGSVASNSRGGICEKPAKDIYEGQRVMKTLNTGMITVINHNTRTSSLMTELTFAHEVGHNLGAEHDDEKCGGDGTNGHYIMYRRATTGLEENNNKFSNCSMEKMGPVVISVKNQLLGKVNCLTECSQVGYCGNRNVEDDEECDCGFISECTDDCCYPAGGPDAKLGCKLKPGARCSPSKGPCCSEYCTFQPSTHICHKDKASQDCIGDVRCDGVQATCPLNDTQFFKPNDTPCNQFTQLCDRGECNKTICTLIGKSECTITIPNVEDPLRQRGVDREYLCHIGCYDTRTNSCVDTLTLRMPNNHSKSGFGYKHRPGHACAGTAGYCDVFGKCRAVDAEGPLTRLKNMLLNEENIRTLTQLTQEYWWAFVLGVLGLIGFMSVFVKICSVHTPSSNPRFKPARTLSLKRGSHGPRPHSAQNGSRQPPSASTALNGGSELTSLQQSQPQSQQQQQQQQQHQQSSQHDTSSIPSMPSVPPSSAAAAAAAMMMMGMKQEDRNLSKLPFSLDKGPPLLHPSGPPPLFPPLNPHHDPLLMNRNNSLFHPMPLHALSSAHKPPGSGASGPPPLNFSLPFGPSPHDNGALRQFDPLGLRLMNPAAAAAAQLFAAQSHFNANVSRPSPNGLDPATAALLLDPRYRSMISPFGTSSPASAGLSSSSAANSSSSSSANASNSAHSHSHVHSHSHTHLHLNNNDSSASGSTNNSNGPTLQPPPMMPFANSLSSLSHAGPLLHSSGPPQSHSSPSMASLEAMHNLSRERELMAFMLANSSRFDPMSLALAANPLQMPPRHEDLSRMHSRERSLREHSENEFRRLNLDAERQQQQQQLRFPFHPQPDDLLRRF